MRRPNNAAVVARDPVAEALDRAPSGSLLTAEQRDACDAILTDIREGRAELVDHEDLPSWLEAVAERDNQG